MKYPTAGVPRTTDGKPNLSAPSPRTPDGKPDFTGIWLTNNTNCAPSPDPEVLVCGTELPMGKEGINMGASLPGGLPYQPWLAALVKKRTAEDSRPWTVTLHQRLAINTELVDEICLENEQSLQRMK